MKRTETKKGCVGREIDVRDLDMIADAKRKMLALSLCVEHLVSTVGVTGDLDERLAALVYAVEASTRKAWKAMRRVHARLS